LGGRRLQAEEAANLRKALAHIEETKTGAGSRRGWIETGAIVVDAQFGCRIGNDDRDQISVQCPCSTALRRAS
jgi:hypothetical protein